MLHIKTIPSIYGNGKQMKDVTFRFFEKIKVSLWGTVAATCDASQN